MHQVMGLGIDEWGSIVAIIGGIGCFFGVIIKVTSVMNRLQNTMEMLDSTLRGLVNDNRFEEHIGEAKVRNQRITSLEHEVYDRKKE